MTYSKSLPKFLILTLSVSTLALSACAGGSGKNESSKPASSAKPTLQTASIDRAMERALADAEANGNAQEILATLQQVHQRHPNDAIVATRYGRALREDDQINASVRTLKPFTSGDNKNVEAVTEMAMAQLALGDFKAAEKYATDATSADPKNARAYLALGTALDAQSNHQDAEIAFRDGLKHWKGDPTPILNNLALNLASQGHLSESLSLLEKALKISPRRMDLERNRRIIATLVETSNPRAPTPSAKPNERVVYGVAPMKSDVPKTDIVPSAEELNARRLSEKAEQKKPAPAPKVEVEDAVDAKSSAVITPTTAAPKSTLKNLKLKTTNPYN